MMNELTGVRVLIAEDHEDVASLMAAILEVAGVSEIDVASDGSEAAGIYDRAKAEGKPYDVLIVDAAMPVTDGFSFAEHVRRSRSDLVTPIVMITGQNDRTLMAAHARHSGIDEMIFKPCEPVDVVGAVGKVLAKRKGEK